MAQLLIESMESEWDPERFHDTHREKVEALIEEKRAGPRDRASEVGSGQLWPQGLVDLMDALQRAR